MTRRLVHIEETNPAEGLASGRVISHIRGLILGGELKPGQRLPPERELARQIGVSRPSVRAGLRSLRAKGVLTTRHGSGTFVSDGPPTHDIRFHRAVASASLNPIVASLVEMVSAIFYARRRRTADRARDLRHTADIHRQIYQAIRSRHRAEAERLMSEHLLQAEAQQDAEDFENPRIADFIK